MYGVFKLRLTEELGYIPISPANPQKENRFILKGWGVKLRVLGWVFGVYSSNSYWLLQDLLSICCQNLNKKTVTSCKTISYGLFKYSRRDLNPHDRNGHWILSPTCLPIPPLEPDLNKKERKTGFEPATLTLAR